MLRHTVHGRLSKAGTTKHGRKGLHNRIVLHGTRMPKGALKDAWKNKGQGK